MFRTPRYQKIKNQDIAKWVHFKVEKFRIFIQPEFVHPPQMGHIITLLYDSASPVPLPSCFSQSISFCKAQLWCHLLQETFLKLVTIVPSSGHTTQIILFPSPPDCESPKGICFITKTATSAGHIGGPQWRDMMEGIWLPLYSFFPSHWLKCGRESGRLEQSTWIACWGQQTYKKEGVWLSPYILQTPNQDLM